MADTYHLFSGEGDPPDCPQETCASVREQIHALCLDHAWPPGHKILVCDPQSGECCYCHCG